MSNVRWKSQLDRAVGDAVESAPNEDVARVLAQWVAILLAPERPDDELQRVSGEPVSALASIAGPPRKFDPNGIKKEARND